MSKKLTIQDIAGFCPEDAIWKMLNDVSSFLIKDDKGCFLSPNSIIIDGNSFIVETCAEVANEYFAPEQEVSQMPKAMQTVWSLGSVAYYMATGHVIFGGYGSYYQKEHPTVPLPSLPKGLQKLNSVLQKCLSYAPDERLSIKELNEVSLQEFVSCKKRERKLSKIYLDTKSKEILSINDKWPEEMIEI